jgi:hypothetical protein
MLKTDRLFSFIIIAVLWIGAGLCPAQAQTPIKESNSADGSARASGEIQFTKLLAQARQRAGFSLLPSNSYPAASGPAFSITPMAAGPNVTVQGSGTIGRLTKWTGFTSSNSFIGDSTMFESKSGLVGLGTDSPTSKLTVIGMIESTSGGVKFPDGTVQMTAGITPNQTVLVRDVDNPASQPVQGELVCTAPPGDKDCSGFLYIVPGGKRLVIEFVSMDAELAVGEVANFTILPLGVSGPNHTFPPSAPSISFGGVKRALFSQSVRLYADPGAFVTVASESQSTVGSRKFRWTFSGYLVDVP